MKCGVCGCRIRGRLHEEGNHHKNQVKLKRQLEKAAKSSTSSKK